MAKKTRAVLFPDEMFVQQYGYGESSYWIANDDEAGAEGSDTGSSPHNGGERVGVYKLVGVVSIKKNETFTRSKAK